MSKLKRLSIFLAAIPLLITVGFLSRSQLASNSSMKSQKLQVINKTQSLEATARLGPDKRFNNRPMVTVKFTNISNRACKGYMMAFRVTSPGNGSGTGRDMKRPEHRLQPGQSTIQSFDPFNITMEDGRLGPVIVEMAIFDDDSIEGNEDWGMDMLGSQLGHDIQFARSRGLYEKLLDVPDESMPAALDKLALEIQSLPTDDDKTYGGPMAGNVWYRAGFRTGLKEGKQALLEEVDWLKRPSHGPLKPNAPITETEVRAMDAAEKRSAIISIVENAKRLEQDVARARKGRSSEEIK
ncbi:MAG: hypothetical protein DMF61_22595 [Blastocatellia bacterium AA13]|nr:MAG: hypothetical protein DMF61_22595 [Blastocatellia bacterium AA13]